NTGIKLYLYYGNAAATPQSNRAGVWDSSFVLVAHMKDPNDSTSHNFKGTLMNAPAAAAGKIGPATTFDGAKDGIDFGNVTAMNGQKRMSTSAWVRLDTVSEYGNIISKSDTSSCSGMSVGGQQWRNDLALRVQDCGVQWDIGAYKWTSGGLLS